jgi:hypothetical protein
LNTRVIRTVWKCSGVKICAHAADYVKQSHTSWSGIDFQKKYEATDISQRIFAEEYIEYNKQKRTLE